MDACFHRKGLRRQGEIRIAGLENGNGGGRERRYCKLSLLMRQRTSPQNGPFPETRERSYKANRFCTPVLLGSFLVHSRNIGKKEMKLFYASLFGISMKAYFIDRSINSIVDLEIGILRGM